MLLTYWRVHLLYTIPITLLLSFFLRPLLSRRHLFTIIFHVCIAVIYTFPWDSYIIRNHAWSYPRWAITFTIADVPIEEVFFFVIQSIFTSQLYILLGLLDTPSQHLLYSSRANSTISRKLAHYTPLIILPTACITGWIIGTPETHTFYLGCIMWWITPVTLFLWSIAGDHFLSRRRTALLTIAIPTIYLCMVDTIALRHGTWHITERTSTGIFVWTDLPLEEALFFTVTNTLLVCGMSAFERCFAIIDVFGDLLASSASSCSTPLQASLTSFEFIKFLVKSILLKVDNLPSAYKARITAFESTQATLSKHSKSFHTASYIFPSHVRRDLVILYAFCRVLDDFCDESDSQEQAKELIEMSKEWLDLLYASPSTPAAISEEKMTSNTNIKGQDRTRSSATAGEASSNTGASSSSSSPYFGPSTHTPSHFELSAFLHKRVPVDAQPAFYLLSTISSRIPRYPFDDLIQGYEWDLASKSIETTEDLVEYSRLVASSVAEMCVWAMWANEGGLETLDEEERKNVLEKAASMGVALQITNIARDIKEDATKGRVYIPKQWFETLPESELEVNGYNEDVPLEKKTATLTPPQDTQELASRRADYETLSHAISERVAPNPSQFRYHTYLNQLLNLAEKHKLGTSEAISKLPRSCQAGIRAATGVYIAIGQEIERKAFGENGKEARLKGERNMDYDGTRVSMTKGQRIRIAFKEVYGF